MAARQLVGVDQQLFARVERSPLAGEQRILPVTLEPRVVEVVATTHRNGAVVFLDAALDLGVDLALERGERLHHRVGVLVLGLEIPEHGGVVPLRQPVVGIDADLAGGLESRRLDRRHRRRGRCLTIGGAVAQQADQEGDEGSLFVHAPTRL